MTKHRLPRKLKKGCRTLCGNPRTKWQHKGRLHYAKTLEDIANKASFAAVCSSLQQQAIERLISAGLPSGGIVMPPTPVVRMMTGESTGEIILHRPERDRLRLLLEDNSFEKYIAIGVSEQMYDVLRKKAEQLAGNIPVKDIYAGLGGVKVVVNKANNED